MRQRMVAGNWKMNTNPEEGLALITDLMALTKQGLPSHTRIMVAPPATHLSIAVAATGSSPIEVGAQNCHYENQGAFTGETSPNTLADMGLSSVILGHSERRQHFGETNNLIRKKVEAALANGLTPVFCCGEPQAVREQGGQEALVKQQLEESLFHLNQADIDQVVIAYEPVWAIGTGLTATPEQAQEMHQYIRSLLAAQYNTEIAHATTILYGGSCKPNNAKAIFEQADVDGGLIGGASLEADSFYAIIQSLPQ